VTSQLSSNGKIRGPEKSGNLPEHYHPDSGPYEDVHVQTAAKAGITAGLMAVIYEVVAPNLNTLVDYGEATPGELLSAAAWDATTALDPVGVSDLINWAFDLE
jgi:hypothetical protein